MGQGRMAGLRFGAALALVLSFVGVQAKAANLGFSWQEGAGGRLGVEVVDRDHGQPVENAEVSVFERLDGAGRSWNSPGYRTEFVLPSTSGSVAVVVKAPGYSTFALVGATHGALKVYLSRLQSAADAIVSGRLGGWAPRSGQDRIQAGLVLRALSVFDLVQFQFNQIISPLRDTIDIMGPRQLPSNLVLPDQRVRIPFSTLHLNKPDYRLPLQAHVPVPLAAVQGEMKSGDVINLFMGGGKFDFGALNILKFTKVGITDLADPRDGMRENFDATYAVAPRHTVTARRAPFPADVVVAAAVDTHNDRNRLVPTDLKTAARAGEQAKAVRLSSAGPELAGPRVVAGLAIGEEGKRLSGVAVIGAGDQVQLSEFRPVNRLEDFQSAPAAVSFAGMAGGLSSLVLSRRLPPDSEGKPQVGEAMATVYALPRAARAQVGLSSLGLNSAEVGRYAVHEFELEQGFDSSRVDGERALHGLKRFTRSVATYK